MADIKEKEAVDIVEMIERLAIDGYRITERHDSNMWYVMVLNRYGDIVSAGVQSTLHTALVEAWAQVDGEPLPFTDKVEE